MESRTLVAQHHTAPKGSCREVYNVYSLAVRTTTTVDEQLPPARNAAAYYCQFVVPTGCRCCSALLASCRRQVLMQQLDVYFSCPTHAGRVQAVLQSARGALRCFDPFAPADRKHHQRASSNGAAIYQIIRQTLTINHLRPPPSP